jgi:hypothetical protein
MAATQLFLGISRAGPGFGLARKKPDGKSLARARPGLTNFQQILARARPAARKSPIFSGLARRPGPI